MNAIVPYITVSIIAYNIINTHRTIRYSPLDLLPFNHLIAISEKAFNLKLFASCFKCEARVCYDEDIAVIDVTMKPSRNKNVQIT